MLHLLAAHLRARPLRSPRKPSTKNLKCDPVDVLCTILCTDGGATRALITAMDEEDIRTFVACPWILLGSDGRAIGSGGALSRDLPHPRFYGTFPRILGHYTRDLGLLTLPQAIHKMTGASAAAIGLRYRGVLRPGAAADITVFDQLRLPIAQRSRSRAFARRASIT
jgi:N-acyl-D-amino-acid deacylase